MLELLAPAGSPEAVCAAIQSGADAVYLGYGDFNARRNAKNFSKEELAAAVSYCHIRGAKVYLTLNTLLTDRELSGAAQVAMDAAESGVDAILVQDLGVLRMLRQCCPTLPLHGSTQMTVHSLDGVLRCADLGLQRVVVSRELSKEAIGYICKNSPIELEIFVHGALCMSYSGQCFFSSVLGGRSGNRGLCAQPCRLNYGWSGKTNEAPLSLKDMSLAGHLKELSDLGVTCLKLEGRMKRPEYVAIVTEIYATALREQREPTPVELERLGAAFSRQGFTDGYFKDQKGPQMFGVREDIKEPRDLFSETRARYQNGELQRIPVTFYAMIRSGEPIQVGVQDNAGRVATAAGPIPEEARSRPLTEELVSEQLSRTGGTPFQCAGVRALVEPSLSVPVSTINSLRRQALEALTAQRGLVPQREVSPFHVGARYENRKEPPILTLSLSHINQLTHDLLRLRPGLIYLPLDVAAAEPNAVRSALDLHIPIAVTLPRICWDREGKQMEEQLIAVKALGVTQVLAGTLDVAGRAKRLGFTIRGDFGIGTFNSQSLKELKRQGFVSATASFELKLAQIRDLSKSIDTELIAYGRLPLMITESCIIKNHSGRHSCDNSNTLTDRKGERFPVVRAAGCRNEILNSKKLFLADKQRDYCSIGLWATRLLFTTENPRECVQVTERYLNQGSYVPNDLTRGLYYRDVE